MKMLKKIGNNKIGFYASMLNKHEKYLPVLERIKWVVYFYIHLVENKLVKYTKGCIGYDSEEKEGQGNALICIKR